MIDRLFLKHPRDAGESYGEHLGVACGVGFRMIGGGLAAVMHGICPALFTTTGSRTIRSLYAELGPRAERTVEAQKSPDADVAAHI